MHIQWFTTLVTETSCVIVNGFCIGHLRKNMNKKYNKKSNINLLFSFKVSKV